MDGVGLNGTVLNETYGTVRNAHSFKSYPSRWLMLSLFGLFTFTNAVQWIHYAIISNVISSYYGVSTTAVDWLSLMFMAVYVPLIFPASWYLELKGLRRAMCIGSFGNMLGALIKCGSIGPNLFWVTFLGQTVAAISQVYVLGIPPYLAAVWFGSDQVSTACSIGVFANLLGIAMGFLLPPIMVPTTTDIEATERGLRIMYYSIGAISALACILIILLFKEKPPTPPSAAAEEALKPKQESYMKGIIRLMRNKPYVLLLLSYGTNAGVFYAVSTLLNQTVLAYFPGETENAGRIGLLIVVAGMAGSVICGYILDKTSKFKLVTMGLFVSCLSFMVAYTFVLELRIMWLVFVVAGGLGFFMTGYLPVGFEFGAELTFPECEGTTSGMLNAVAQVIGIACTLGGGKMFELYSDRAVNLLFCGVLLFGAVMTGLIKEDLRRQRMKLREVHDGEHTNTHTPADVSTLDIENKVHLQSSSSNGL